MRIIVSLVLLALPVFIGQSVAQAENCNKSILVRDISVQGLDGAGGRTARGDFDFSMKELPKICRGECNPCAVLSANVFPVGEVLCFKISENDVQDDSSLEPYLGKELCSQQASVACACTGLAKNISEADMDLVR